MDMYFISLKGRKAGTVNYRLAKFLCQEGVATTVNYAKIHRSFNPPLILILNQK